MVSPLASSPPLAFAPPLARWRSVVGWLGGLALAAVLLSAAAAKALDPQAFAEQIRGEKLDFVLPAMAVALVALAIEAGLGAALALGLRRRWILVAATLLTLFFLFLTGRNYWRDAHHLPLPSEGCGCWGALVERTPAEAFWQDLALLLPALGLAWMGPLRGPRVRGETFRLALVVVAAAGTVLFAWRAPQLPLDDLATRLRPGRTLAGLCAGGGADRVCLDGLLADGGAARQVVVLGVLGDPDFLAAVPELNRYALAGRGPALTVLAPFTNEEAMAFNFTAAPAFTPRSAPAGLLRPLYRRLPRSFLVEGGRVISTWTGLPPLAELAAEPATRG